MKLVYTNGVWVFEKATGEAIPFQNKVQEIVNDQLPSSNYVVATCEENHLFSVMSMGNDPRFLDTGSLDLHFHIGIFVLPQISSPIVIIYDIQNPELANQTGHVIVFYSDAYVVGRKFAREITPAILDKVKNEIITKEAKNR